jgi:hypothetical protein
MVSHLMLLYLDIRPHDCRMFTSNNITSHHHLSNRSNRHRPFTMLIQLPSAGISLLDCRI